MTARKRSATKTAARQSVRKSVAKSPDTARQPTSDQAANPLSASASQIAGTAIDDPSHESEVIETILRGRKRSAGSLPKHLQDHWMISDWSRGLTQNLQNVYDTLKEFELSDERTHRENSSKLLVAFLAWARFGGEMGDGATRAQIDEIRGRFLDVILAQMVGFEDRNGGFDAVPKWSSPDVAFGWAKARGRPKEDHSWRDVGILAAFTLLIREGVEPKVAKSRLAKRVEPRKLGAASHGVDIVRSALDASRFMSNTFNILPLGQLRDFVAHAAPWTKHRKGKIHRF